MESESAASTQLNKLICPVCYYRFKTTKILPCGHTFCQPCVHQLFQSTPISCPVCRIQVSTPHTLVDQLPTNYALKAFVDTNASLFDKESICRSFGECPTHENVCDQFCKTCEKKVCTQCIIDHHQGPSHDTSPVGTVAVQQREDLDKLVTELSDLMKRLKLIEVDFTKSEKTCQSEADQWYKDIGASADECTDKTVGYAESLQVIVNEEKKKILQYLKVLKLKRSENFLLASFALDLWQSLQAELDKSNLSRVAVMKILTENKNKIENELEHLEGKEDDLETDLKFHPIQ